MNLKEKYGEWGVILGATEGVGKAFCEKIAAGGMNVVMVGRREEKLKEIEKKVNDIATKLGIKDVLQKYPYQMSGGQKQRVASARAIVTDPQIVLADEPTGALDSKSSRMLLESFDYLNERLNTTILMVTHDSFCASYASRVIFIKDGKVFNEIIKGNSSRKEFFDKIIDVVTLLGGEENDNY